MRMPLAAPSFFVTTVTVLLLYVLRLRARYKICLCVMLKDMRYIRAIADIVDITLSFDDVVFRGYEYAPVTIP